MKKKYSTPSTFVFNFIAEQHLLSLSNGSTIQLDEGGASDGNFTNQKHPIWGNEEEEF